MSSKTSPEAERARLLRFSFIRDKTVAAALIPMPEATIEALESAVVPRLMPHESSAVLERWGVQICS
jgi:hypothetical protein